MPNSPSAPAHQESNGATGNKSGQVPARKVRPQEDRPTPGTSRQRPWRPSCDGLQPRSRGFYFAALKVLASWLAVRSAVGAKTVSRPPGRAAPGWPGPNKETVLTSPERWATLEQSSTWGLPMPRQVGENGCTPEMARKIVALLDLDPGLGGSPLCSRDRACERCGKATRPPQRFCSHRCWETARTGPRPKPVCLNPMGRAERLSPGLLTFVRQARSRPVEEIRSTVMARFGVPISPCSIYRVWQAETREQLAREGSRTG